MADKELISVNKLDNSERDKLKMLLKTEKLCFNDVNTNGVHLFEVKIVDHIVGYFGIELFGSYALFRSMVVKPAARNKGYGELIWQQARQKLLDKKAKEVFLLTNTAASFFSKQGFIEIPRSSVPDAIATTTEFVDFCPSDSVCMKIKLAE